MEIKYFRQSDTPKSIPPLAARAGDFVFLAGGIAAHPVKGVPSEVKPPPGYPYHGSSIERQLRYILNNMTATLEKAGSSIKRVMKINSYNLNGEEIDMGLRVRKEYFGIESPPPATTVTIPETSVRGATVVLDIVSLASDAKLDRKPLHKNTNKTPLPIHDVIYGHPIFMQAVRGGGFIFTSGVTASMALAGKQEALQKGFKHPDFPYREKQIKFQTELILEYLKSLLNNMDASLDNVVKADVHMYDMNDLAGMDAIWRNYFPNNPPARTILPAGTSRGLAAANTIIEVELIAVDPCGPYHKDIIYSKQAPEPIGQESQAVKAGPFIFISGQMATDYEHGLAPEARVDPNFPFHSSSTELQVKYIIKNVESICQTAGSSAENLVRRRAMYSDLNELSDAEEVWVDVLGERLPPTTTFRTAGPFPVPDCTVQYDLIGYAPGSH